MRARIGALLLSAAALATVAAALSVAPANAATTWTVRPGGTVTASRAGTLTDKSTGTVAKCTVSITVKLKGGTGLANPIGTITSFSITCPDFTGQGGTSPGRWTQAPTTRPLG